MVRFITLILIASYGCSQKNVVTKSTPLGSKTSAPTAESCAKKPNSPACVEYNSAIENGDLVFTSLRPLNGTKDSVIRLTGAAFDEEMGLEVEGTTIPFFESVRLRLCLLCQNMLRTA